MQIDIFTLFPEIFPPYLEASIVKRALEAQLLGVNVFNIRDWATDKHKMTDDVPYGGGGGMVLKPEPIFNAVEAVMGNPPCCPLILLTPQGKKFDQAKAMELAKLDRFALLCGRYEGVDERVREHLVSEELSIGDFVLTGGELPALMIIDAVTRLLPGALGDPDGATNDSIATGLLEHPHYTRPAEFRGWKVPDVLRSGNHAKVAQWRKKESLRRTVQRRPDLLNMYDLTELDEKFLDELDRERLDKWAAQNGE